MITTNSLSSLHRLDWDDLGAVSRAADAAYAELLSDRGSLLIGLLDQLPDRANLVAMCETYDFMDKLVLHDDREHGFRVRLHRFRSGYFDRPHNHRWSFASKILNGSYSHTYFGSDRCFAAATLETLPPLQVWTERPGDSYVLHHSAVHSVIAEAGTISLILRGPAAKDSFRILDAVTGGSFFAYGTQNESQAQRDVKQMTPDRLAQTIEDIRLVATAWNPVVQSSTSDSAAARIILRE